MARRAAALAAQGRTPGLAVILVGDDPASAVYVRNKVRACEEVGIASKHIALDAATSSEALLSVVRGLNEDIDRLRNVVATDVRNEAELAQRLVEADQARVSAEVTLDGAELRSEAKEEKDWVNNINIELEKFDIDLVMPIFEDGIQALTKYKNLIYFLSLFICYLIDLSHNLICKIC